MIVLHVVDASVIGDDLITDTDLSPIMPKHLRDSLIHVPICYDVIDIWIE